MRDHAKEPAVYILASKRNRTLYVGVTSDLLQRGWQHRAGEMPGFANRHAVKRLVYFEMHDCMNDAILREKQLKKWNRAWKIKLIEDGNPYWNDLWPTICPD